MSTTVINIKTDPKIKKKAKKLAAELGLTLSGVINAQLRQFVRSKTIFCSLDSEIPTRDLLQDIEQAKIDHKKGETFSFDDVNSAIKFLDK